MPQVVHVVRCHYESTGFPAEVSFNADLLTRYLQGLILSPQGALLVAVLDGVVIGAHGLQLETPFFAPDLTAHEVFLFVQPGYRGLRVGAALIEYAEQWAISAGAKSIIIGNHPLSPPHVKDAYLRRGYREAQTEYIKRL